MKRLIGFILCALTLCMVLFSASSCSDGAVMILSDYSDYISDLFQYYYNDDEESNGNESDNQQTPPSSEYKPVEAEEYEGLIAIEPYKFDFAINFFGEYGYASRNGKNYLIDRRGNLTEINDESDNTSSDIIIEEIKFDKLVVSHEEKYGVLDLFGKVIAEIKYDFLDVSDKIIIGKINDETDVFYQNKVLHKIQSENVSIVSDELLSVDGIITDVITLTEATVGGYALASVPKEGIVKVKDNRGRFGYCSYPDGQILIEPDYFISGDFVNGVAYAFEYCADLINMVFVDYPILIDKNNNILFDFEIYADEVLPNKINVFENYDNCSVYSIDNPVSKRYGIVAKNGSEYINKELKFVPANNRVYGNYYLVEDTDQLCSLKDDVFVESVYLKFYPAGNMFIAETNDKTYSLLDSDLNIVIESCENIEYYDGIFMVKSNAMFAYYKTI